MSIVPKSLHEWLAFIERQHPKPIDMGLARVQAVATRMGLARPAQHVITVGGTNGKGSTVAFIEAIAREAGWLVGAYTSPHLMRYNERVRIDGVEVDDDALVAGFEAVEAARACEQRRDISLTYFEYGTLCALWLFGRAGLDLVILEVGLGGRLDAVNIVDADVAVITTVDIDHQQYLGHDRETIGFEKAGIARPGKPLVLGEDDPPSSVLGHAYAIGAAAIRANCDFFFQASPCEGGSTPSTWQWRELNRTLELPLPRMQAPAQFRNAATAIAALRAIPREIAETAIARGIANVQLAGRMQQLQRHGVDIIVDVGHNPQAARGLADWLRQAPISGRTFAVFAALIDKDIAGLVAALDGQVTRWFLAGLDDAGTRGVPVAEFAQRLSATVAADGERHAGVAEAFAAALAQARAGDRILVFGSFHTAAAVLRFLKDFG